MPADLFGPAVTPREAGKMLGVSVETIRRMIRQGRLHPLPERGPKGVQYLRRVEVEDLQMRAGQIRPRFAPDELVLWRGDLRQVTAYRPSLGYLLFGGEGSYDWVSEGELEPARISSKP